MSHFWSSTSPIRCLGCGIEFSDIDDVDRAQSLARQGMVEDKNCRQLHDLTASKLIKDGKL